MEKELVGFQIPERPKQNKALVYIIYDHSMPLAPEKVSFNYSAIDEEKYEKNVGKANILFEILTLGLLEDQPLKNTTKISTLKRGEYTTINLDPGHYEFQYEIVTPSSLINGKPAPKFLKLESSNIYYIFIEYGIFYNRYSNSTHHNLYIRDLDELTGKYHLYKNFKKAEVS